MAYFSPKRTDPVPQVYISAKCKGGVGAGIGVYWNKDDADTSNVSEPLEADSTNNSALIEAAIRAVKQAKKKKLKEITVISRSNYLTNSMGVWIEKWKDNEWKKGGGKSVKNITEITELMDACEGMTVNWEYVNSDEDEGIVRAKSLAEKGLKKCETAKKQEPVDQLAQQLSTTHLNTRH